MVTGVFREMFPVEHPFVLGYEAAGTVEAVGEGVTGFVKGDEVVALTVASIAECIVVNAGRVPERQVWGAPQLDRRRG